MTVFISGQLRNNIQARDLLKDGKDVRKCTWSNKEIEALNKHLLLTSKPVIYLINMGEKDYIKKKGKWLLKIKKVGFFTFQGLKLDP